MSAGRFLACGLTLVLAACQSTPSESAVPSASASASAPARASAPASLPGVAPVAFYHPDAAVVAATSHGKIIEAAEIRGLTGTRAWTITYGSTGLDGTPVVVSGIILAPADPAKGSTYPVVAWAHGTTGIADECAPSRAGIEGIPGEVRGLVAQGYVVTATDYEGLGTDGIHPYLVGISEGRAVLDSILAAQGMLETQAGAQAVVIGHSQGGHAALWAGELAPTYAPDLELLGAMAASPPTDLTAWERWAFDKAAQGEIYAAIAPILLFGVWNDVCGLSLDFLTDEGRRSALDGRETCFPSAITSTPYLADPALLPDWGQRLIENSPGVTRTDVPMRVVSPTDDHAVQSESQQAGVSAMCRIGDTVELLTVSGDHDASIRPPSAWSAITDWISGRFAGLPVVSTCPS